MRLALDFGPEPDAAPSPSPRKRSRRRRDPTYNPATPLIRFDSLNDERANLVSQNTALAYWAAEKYAACFPALSREGRQSACIDGLCNAAKKYRDDRCTVFSTYATRAMLNEMHRANEKASRMKAVSLTVLFRHGFDQGSEDQLLDVRLNLEKSELKGFVDKLPKRRQRIIRMRFGIGCDAMTLGAIAAVYGKKTAWVKKEIAAALDSLRAEYGEEPNKGEHK